MLYVRWNYILMNAYGYKENAAVFSFYTIFVAR